MLVNKGDMVRFKLRRETVFSQAIQASVRKGPLIEGSVVQKEDKDCFEPSPDIKYDYDIELAGPEHKWEGDEFLAVVSSEPDLLYVSLDDEPLYQVQVTTLEPSLYPELTLNSFQFEVVSETQDAHLL